MWGHEKRKFYSLNEIAAGYNLSQTALDDCILEKFVSVHFWMPPTSVYHLSETVSGAQVFLSRAERLHEGYTELYPVDYRRLLRKEPIHLREFPADGNGILTLRHGVPDIIIRKDDVVVLSAERRKLDEALNLRSAASETIVESVMKIINPAANKKATFDPSFRHVEFKGRSFSFGMMQAAILRQLFDAAKSGNPWLNGKQMLHDAGSESFTLANVFSSQPFWREIIQSDKRGLYALNDEFRSSITADHKPVMTPS